MATLSFDEFVKQSGGNPTRVNLVSDSSKSKPEAPSFIDETKKDFGETISGIKNAFQTSIQKQKSAVDASISGEQSIGAGFAQAFGAGAGGLSNILGEIVKGGVKMVLPQSAEDKLKSTAQAAAKPIVESAPIQKLMQNYDSLPENEKRTVDALLGVSNLALDLTGVGAARKVGTEGAKVGAELSIKSLGKAGELIEGGAKAARPAVAKGTGAIGEFGSNVPRDVIESAVKDPSGILAAQKDVYKLSQPQVLEKLQGATRQMRKNLSDFYSAESDRLITKNAGTRFGFNESEQKLITKVAEKYNIEIPQNLNNLSLKEGLKLNSEFGSLKSMSDIASTAEGKPVRDLAATIRKKLTSSFAGKDGKSEVDSFLKNYSTKKSVFDSADELFNAFQTKDPKKVAAAYRNMVSAFKEDKFAYINTIDELAKNTGGNLVDELKALQFKPILNKSGKMSWDDIFRLAIFPISSPRVVGIEAKALGRIINTAENTGALLKKISANMKK